MCNCIEEKVKEIEAKLPEMIKEKDPGFTDLISFGIKDIIISFSEKSPPPFMLKLEAVYDRRLKNGKIRQKKIPVNLTPIYCPLCGFKY